MSLKDKDWYKHVVRQIEEISEFSLRNPLGYYSTPKEYMNIVEDFGKLLYGINEMPALTHEEYNEARNAYNEFQVKLGKFCKSLLEKAKENDNDTTKDKKINA